MSEYFDSMCAVLERPEARVRAGASTSFWRKDDPILDDKGRVIKGGMWGPQRAWWELPNFIKLLVGGYGAGKTMIGAKRTISDALTNAPCPVAAVSPTYPLARKTMIPTIEELLAGKQQLLGNSFWFRYNKSVSEFKIRYHGRTGTIFVCTGEDPDSLRGPNLASAWIDEPFIQELAVFNQMIARIRHPDATLEELLLTGTPEQLNWGYDLAMGELKDRHDVGFVKASTRVNLALRQSYVQNLEGAFDGKAGEAYIDGDFVNLAEGLVYYKFGDYNIKTLAMPDFAELGCGMDFNVNPMAATVFWKQGDHMHFFDEIELRNSDTEYMCGHLVDKYVKSKMYSDNPLRKIYPDASGNSRKSSSPEGKTDFHYIRAAGFDIEANRSNPKRKDRFNSVNGKLKSASGRVTTTVDPKCKKLIKYLRLNSHELINKPDQKKMLHLLDAFGYPQAYLFPIVHEEMEIVPTEGH